MRDFHHSVNVLVVAYINGTLEHGKCSRCAVGNILGGWEWARIFLTVSHTADGAITDQIQLAAGKDEVIDQGLFTYHTFKVSLLRPVVLEQKKRGEELIARSGYSKEELMKIEWAFESVRMEKKDHDSDEDMFNGLMAVVDVLADIHGIDLEHKEEAKALFVKS